MPGGAGGRHVSAGTPAARPAAEAKSWVNCVGRRGLSPAQPLLMAQRVCQVGPAENAGPAAPPLLGAVVSRQAGRTSASAAAAAPPAV